MSDNLVMCCNPETNLQFIVTQRKPNAKKYAFTCFLCYYMTTLMGKKSPLS